MTSEFETTLDLYRRNIVDYKVSGNAAFKVAADVAKKWLDDHLALLNTQADAKATEIQQFVENYDKSDVELASLKNDMRMVRQKGPELQTLYETEHNSEVREEIDYTQYYAKGAVLFGVGALIAVASVI